MKTKKVSNLSIYLISGLFWLSLENTFLAHACCDAEPKNEIVTESAGGKYVAVLTPSYSIRLISNVPIETYNEKLVLLLARRDNKNESYKTLWQVELEEKSSDSYELFVSDHGCLVIKSESTNYLSSDAFMQVIDQKGGKITSYSERDLVSLTENERYQIKRSDTSGYFSDELFIFHYDKIKYEINCRDGKLTLLENQ